MWWAGSAQPCPPTVPTPPCPPRRSAPVAVPDGPRRGQYDATTHFNGQSTITLDGDRATGESHTIAHHLFSTDGERKIMVAALRYLDTFTKVDGTWLFAERQLILDWSETRPSQP